jgi:hypothetical protein
LVRRSLDVPKIDVPDPLLYNSRGELRRFTADELSDDEDDLTTI